MKNISRRNFLTKSALATTGSLFIPNFLKAFDGKSTSLKQSNKKLIVIQFSGGNDGLNAIVPYQNDVYYKNRPTIAIPKSKVIKLNDNLGFNPSLQPLQKWFDRGDMSIINNIGYPNPDRSHFRSMDIWHTASATDQFLSSGWLGRFLDTNSQNAHHAIELDDTLSLALKGKTKNGFAMQNPKKLHKVTHSKITQSIMKHHHDHQHEENIAYLHQTLSNTVSSADYIFEKSKVYTSTQSYPKGKVGSKLKQIAELIIGGADTQVYYLNIGGFDTHSNQNKQQNKLLNSYALAVDALMADLKKNGFWEDTLIMTFSEFGRRVAENGSGGTDHGKGNNLYLMGGGLKKGGFYNSAPNLELLDKGDLSFEIDFRRVYASILKDWLKDKGGNILHEKFESLGIF